MNAAQLIGELLPQAVTIAISPIPIIAAILMLLSARARSVATAFLAGWVVGIAVAAVVVTLLASAIPTSDPDSSKPIVGVVKIVLGVLLVLLAVHQWRGRPADGATPAPPAWMTAIDSITPVKAAGLAFLLAAVNPKNLLMAVAAGVSVGTSGASTGAVVGALVVFVVIASVSVGVPVLGFLVLGTRLADGLSRLRDWLTHNNATIMAVLLLVIGVVTIGKGIGDF
ncbi:Sap, sulfolipid-1-addressing protein [Curtobacterium sp. 314Chir4.1]|uniref:GAP family protein n=1 Tax=Curtobacterium sp. 314Chir4.1 TaxID=1279028 RepID=UPI000BC963A7|nr:GAP family protein [Curtobacterium sp. 314Chir4.1]SOC88183.1 Sap, sulfolipid-1-addressing protein [Curtobacterium sp. 314Chir4.1]